MAGVRSTSKSWATCVVAEWTLTSENASFGVRASPWSHQLTSDPKRCLLSWKCMQSGDSLAWTCLKADSVLFSRASVFVMGGLRGFVHTCFLFARRLIARFSFQNLQIQRGEQRWSNRQQWSMSWDVSQQCRLAWEIFGRTKCTDSQFSRFPAFNLHHAVDFQIWCVMMFSSYLCASLISSQVKPEQIHHGQSKRFCCDTLVTSQTRVNRVGQDENGHHENS